MANPHTDIPAGIDNEKGSSVLCHKDFLGKACKESQYHLIGEGVFMNNKLSAHEHCHMSSSGWAENSCVISSYVSCYSQMYSSPCRLYVFYSL